MSTSRRSFLRGTAGAILALPFLEALPGPVARAADLPRTAITGGLRAATPSPHRSALPPTIHA